MKVISAPNRGTAVVGAGYFYQCRDAEDVTQQANLWGAVVQGNDRQFDLWRAAALGGQATRPMAAMMQRVVRAGSAPFRRP
jgi:hypothetical protein